MLYASDPRGTRFHFKIKLNSTHREYTESFVEIKTEQAIGDFNLCVIIPPHDIVLPPISPHNTVTFKNDFTTKTFPEGPEILYIRDVCDVFGGSIFSGFCPLIFVLLNLCVCPCLAYKCGVHKKTGDPRWRRDTGPSNLI